MVFPLGGDFPRTVAGGFNIVSSDPAGGEVGTFLLSSPGTSALYIIAGLSDTVSDDYVISQLSVSISSTIEHIVRDTDVDNDVILAALSGSVSGNGVVVNTSSTISGFWFFVQFYPGVLPHLPDTYSDLYIYDVFQSFRTYNRQAIHFLSYVLPDFKIEDDISIYGSLVQTDYYTTISGSVSECVGDEEPPVLTLIEPAASGIQVRPRNQIIDFVLSDAVGGVDISTVFVTIDSTTSGTFTVVSNGADQTGGHTSIVGDPSGYQITYTPPFLWDFNDQVTVTVSGADLIPTVGGNPFFCGDNDPNHLVAVIPFQVLNQEDISASVTIVGDISPPFISLSSPASGTTGNNVFTPFILKIADSLTGVDLSKTTVSVNSTPIVVEGAPQSSETVVVGTPAEYQITYTPDNAFAYDSTALIEAYSEDLVTTGPTNVLDTSYTFDFISDGTLVIENFIPGVGTHHNVHDLDIEVDVRDDTYGVDASQTFFVINGTIVSGTQTPLASGVRLSYHPPNDFDFDEPIKITVHGTNANTSAPAVKESFFTLFYGCRILYDPAEDFGHFESVDVFVRARNVEAFFRDLSTGYFFTTYTQPNQDLGASIMAINPKSDLPASIIGEGPEHRYGQTVTVVFSVEDFNGNLLGPFTYTYTIENNPT